MKLSRNGQIVVSIAFTASLLLSGIGFAQAKAVESKYQEQSKQMELYRQELNEAQSLIQENTSYKAAYECVQVERDQLQKQVDELSK
ncbi:MAG: hypothetical protein KH086_04565 [Coprobacillus sp.]|nr:hypothetical protein [Coprobacillus sp.]